MQLLLKHLLPMRLNNHSKNINDPDTLVSGFFMPGLSVVVYF